MVMEEGEVTPFSVLTDLRKRGEEEQREGKEPLPEGSGFRNHFSARAAPLTPFQ